MGNSLILAFSDLTLAKQVRSTNHSLTILNPNLTHPRYSILCTQVQISHKREGFSRTGFLLETLGNRIIWFQLNQNIWHPEYPIQVGIGLSDWAKIWEKGEGSGWRAIQPLLLPQPLLSTQKSPLLLLCHSGVSGHPNSGPSTDLVPLLRGIPSLQAVSSMDEGNSFSLKSRCSTSRNF